MKIVEDNKKFEQLQGQLAVEILKLIKKHLATNDLSEDAVYNITSDLGFDICAVLDGSAVLGTRAKPLVPYVTFATSYEKRDTVIVRNGGSYLHEIAVGIAEDLFASKGRKSPAQPATRASNKILKSRVEYIDRILGFGWEGESFSNVLKTPVNAEGALQKWELFARTFEASGACFLESIAEKKEVLTIMVEANAAITTASVLGLPLKQSTFSDVGSGADMPKSFIKYWKPRIVNALRAQLGAR